VDLRFHGLELGAAQAEQGQPRREILAYLAEPLRRPLAVAAGVVKDCHRQSRSACRRQARRLPMALGPGQRKGPPPVERAHGPGIRSVAGPRWAGARCSGADFR